MERYIVTGAQLGLIEAELKHKNVKSALKTLKEIFEKQFIGNSPDNLREDVKDLSKAFFPTREVMGKSKGVIIKREEWIKTKVGNYLPVKIKKGVNETFLQDYTNNNKKPLKEGDIFWMVNLGNGASFDCERQEDAEIISRLVKIENKLDRWLKIKC